MNARRAAVAALAVALASTPYARPQLAGPMPAEAAKAQTAAAQSQLVAHLNAIGFGQLASRAASVAELRTRADGERRQAEVRRTILELVGGLPPASGAVTPRRFATVADEGFRIENIAYESVPGYWVTANVNVPAGAGPFPARRCGAYARLLPGRARSRPAPQPVRGAGAGCAAVLRHGRARPGDQPAPRHAGERRDRHGPSGAQGRGGDRARPLFESERLLGTPDRVRLRRRERGDPLPID